MAKSLKGVWLIVFCLLLASCATSNQTVDAPHAVDGQLNLQDWDFNTNGQVNLSGEWAFYWQELLSPSQIETASPSQYVPVPETWTSYELNGQSLPPEGYATYHLEVQLPDSNQIYGIFIAGEGTAYNLWVDGKLVAQNGQVGTNIQEMIPQSKPLVVFFQPKGDKTEFVIQISNWHHRKAGFRNELQLGLPEQIRTQQNNERSFEAALMGIYLIMALYHIFIYGYRPSNRSPLYFSLLGLVYCIRTGLLNQKILVLLLPAMSWETALRIEYLTFYLVSPVYVLFIRSLYPSDMPRWVTRIVTGVAAGFIGYMFLIDTLSLSYTTTAYQGILLIETAYFIFFIGHIIARKREGAYYIASASMIAFAGGILEILSLQKIIPVKVDGTITFLAFIFIQAIMLSARLSKSFHRVEVLSGELEDANASLRLSERKYRAIFEESKDMIFIAGLDEQIKDANPASEEILGYTKAELQQMKMSDLVVHAKDKEKVENMLRGQAIVRDYELELSKKNGEVIHGLVMLTLRRNENNEINEIQGRVQDVSARKQAEVEKMRALEFEQLAITDPLTNVYNRRFFDEFAIKEWERTRRSKSPLSIILIDIDHFKQVNDTYGHLVGDQVLVSLASLCQSNMRSMDIFARYGGEEFVILMPDADLKSVHQTIDRLRLTVESEAFAASNDTKIHITISAGIANWNGKDTIEIRELIERADQALYQSKNTGRNKVTLWKTS